MGAWLDPGAPSFTARALDRSGIMRNWRFLRTFGGDETAQDAVEYALLIGFVVVASAAGIDLVLEAIKALWNTLNAQLSNPG